MNTAGLMPSFLLVRGYVGARGLGGLKSIQQVTVVVATPRCPNAPRVQLVGNALTLVMPSASPPR
jgi:hypothetical protein